MIRLSRKGAEKLAAKHGAGLRPGQLELDSETITFWFLNLDARDAAEAAAAAVGLELSAVVSSNGSKAWINYRRAPLDLGDPGDPGSLWNR